MVGENEAICKQGGRSRIDIAPRPNRQARNGEDEKDSDACNGIRMEMPLPAVYIGLCGWLDASFEVTRDDRSPFNLSDCLCFISDVRVLGDESLLKILQIS